MPLKKGRQTRLKELAKETRTIVFYESPHRLLKTIDELILHCGSERQASITREISKIYEETIRGNLLELKQYFNNQGVKGEFVVCLAGI